MHTRQRKPLRLALPVLLLGLVAAQAAAQDAPQPPRSVRVLQAGLRQITLGWIPSPDPAVQGYVVYRQDEPGGPFREVGTVRGWQSTSFSDTGRLLRRLKDSTAYVYSVAAFTSDGRTGAPSPAVRAVTAGAPRPVEGLRASGGARSVTLRWQPSSELAVAGYRIWRATERDAEYSRAGTVRKREEATYVDGGLEDMTQYFYMVTALNQVGVESDPCQPVQARTAAPPMTPIGLAALSNGIGQVLLRWEPNPEPNLARYQVLRSTKADSGYRIVGEAGPQESRFLDLGVKPGTLYFYSLLAVDFDALRSQPCPPVRAFTRAPPLTPAALSARAYRGNVLLEWSPSADPNVAGYLVYQKRRFRWQVIGRSVEPRFVVSGLSPELHKFRVASYLASGLESAPSEILKLVPGEATAVGEPPAALSSGRGPLPAEPFEELHDEPFREPPSGPAPVRGGWRTEPPVPPPVPDGGPSGASRPILEEELFDD
jgi:fibronectin type 3 domain-containing protein